MSKYELPEWPNVGPVWTQETLEILLEGSTVIPQNITLDDVLRKSEEFPITFPIDTVRCKTLKNAVSIEVLENNINSAYPLIHENAFYLYAQFILYKRMYGSNVEKQFYKSMTILNFVERLLKKRAVMFMGRFDKYLLLDGTTGSGKWDLIGKDVNNSKLSLENCLSYDEIKLSVFLSVSSYSYFINDGTRKNMGKPSANRRNIQDEGIVIGLVGARLKKVGAMEYEEMVITKTQNVETKGYGSASNKSVHGVFSKFYEEPCFTFQEMMEFKKNSPLRFTDLGNEEFFDNVVFSKRISLSIDTLLLEANHRAKEKKTMAYIHVVGIGLGVWKCSPHQEEVFVETFAKRLKALDRKLAFISDIHFSYFKVKKCGECKNEEKMKIPDHPKNGITIYIDKREPHTKLGGAHLSKLLVVSYAWDGNAFPGNEFWSGKLSSTGDSAAASSTQITEIHNPLINPKVCAENLQIVTQSGLIAFGDYQQKVNCDRKRKREGTS